MGADHRILALTFCVLIHFLQIKVHNPTGFFFPPQVLAIISGLSIHNFKGVKNLKASSEKFMVIVVPNVGRCKLVLNSKLQLCRI